MSERTYRTAHTLVLSALGLSCQGEEGGTTGPELPPVEFSYHTRYFDIASLSDTPVCAGTLAMLDAHVESTVDILDLPLTRRIELYLQHPGDPLPQQWCSETWTGRRAEGCYWNSQDVIFTNYEALPHEIVHAITDEVGNNSWWVEGAARGLSQTPPIYPDFSPGWSDRLGENGHLSRWLIDHYGGDVYMKLYSGTSPKSADQASVEAALFEIIGASFDETLSEYAATAPLSFPDPWLCYTPSNSAETLWRDGYWETAVTLDCDQSNTFSFGGDVTRRTLSGRIPVTIPQADSYYFLADHEDAELFIQPCSEEPSFTSVLHDQLPLPLPGLVAGPKTLEAGPHVLIIDLPPDEPVSLRLVGYVAISL